MLVHLPVPTYHSHEIVRVLSNPSRHYGGVQWVFSPSVHCLPFRKRTLVSSVQHGPLRTHMDYLIIKNPDN